MWAHCVLFLDDTFFLPRSSLLGMIPLYQQVIKGKEPTMWPGGLLTRIDYFVSVVQ